jgi:hypothetical protein
MSTAAAAKMTAKTQFFTRMIRFPPKFHEVSDTV